jgi:predicted ATPase
MISHIDFKEIALSKNFKYAASLDFFKQHETMDFKPGLNIIFAPNGTGKSTILKVLAQFTASEQGGVSTLTNSWSQDVMGFDGGNLKGLNVQHDGQPVMYTNPREAVGLIGGMAGFDDDFFDQGIMEVQLHQSTGLTTLHRMNRILSVLTGKSEFPKEIVKKSRVSEEAKKLLEASIPVGQKTIIMDEPESGLAIHVQANIWKVIQKAAIEQDLQIIVATHCPFSLTCEANYIELQPGYIEIAKNCIKQTAQYMEILDKIKNLTEENKPTAEEDVGFKIRN